MLNKVMENVLRGNLIIGLRLLEKENEASKNDKIITKKRTNSAFIKAIKENDLSLAEAILKNMIKFQYKNALAEEKKGINKKDTFGALIKGISVKKEEKEMTIKEIMDKYNEISSNIITLYKLLDRKEKSNPINKELPKIKLHLNKLSKDMYGFYSNIRLMSIINVFGNFIGVEPEELSQEINMFEEQYLSIKDEIKNVNN